MDACKHWQHLHDILIAAGIYGMTLTFHGKMYFYYILRIKLKRQSFFYTFSVAINNT